MLRNEILDIVKKVVKNHLQLDNNYFEQYEEDGENLYLSTDLGADMLDKFEILSAVEHKCGILVNDEELVWQNDLTIGQYADAIYNEIQKNIKNKY